MEQLFHRFVSDEKGSVATDWMTLVAGVFMLGLAVAATLSPSAAQMAANSHSETRAETPVL